MNQRAAFVLLGVLLVFALGVGWIFQLRLNGGDIYPRYSTLRADSSGLAAIYAALNRLPGIQISRWLRNPNELDTKPSQTLIFAGLTPGQWNAMSSEKAEWLAQSARSGARVVITFAGAFVAPQEKTNGSPPGDKKTGEEKDEKTKDGAKKDEGPPSQKFFGVKAESKLIFERTITAAKSVSDLTLPQSTPWQALVTFQIEPTADWKIKYAEAGSALLIERRFGRGSIVMAGDTYFLTNEAVSRHEATPLITWILGSSSEIIFDETHLGLEKDVGIAALARRYGLGAAMVLLIGFTALYIWRRTAVFVPQRENEGDAVLAIDHTAGLEILLRRALPRNQLIETCLAEFKPARSSDKQRVQKAVSAADAYLVSKYNAAVRSLRLKS